MYIHVLFLKSLDKYNFNDLNLLRMRNQTRDQLTQGHSDQTRRISMKNSKRTEMKSETEQNSKRKKKR